MARRRPSAPMTMISLTGFTALSAGLLLIFVSSFLLQAQGKHACFYLIQSYISVLNLIPNIRPDEQIN